MTGITAGVDLDADLNLNLDLDVLRFEIWNENTLADELIGTFHVNISGILTSQTLREKLSHPGVYPVDSGGTCQCKIQAT